MDRSHGEAASAQDRDQPSQRAGFPRIHRYFVGLEIPERHLIKPLPAAASQGCQADSIREGRGGKAMNRTRTRRSSVGLIAKVLLVVGAVGLAYAPIVHAFGRFGGGGGGRFGGGGDGFDR